VNKYYVGGFEKNLKRGPEKKNCLNFEEYLMMILKIYNKKK